MGGSSTAASTSTTCTRGTSSGRKRHAPRPLTSIDPRENSMTTSGLAGDPIKVGVIADQTGPLSFVGVANGNVARMVLDSINAEGGLLGRPLELCLEDSATDDVVAAAKAAKLVEQDQVDIVFGGIYSSTRQAIKAQWSPRARRSTSTRSSTRGRSPIRSSSAPARCPHSRSIRSSRG